MSNRFNNRKLLFILGGLIVILVITFVVKIPGERSTLDEKILDIDTASVYRIKIAPKASSGEPFEFARENGKWTVKQGNIVAEPRNGAVKTIFSELLSVKPQSLAAVDKAQWKEFELTDSLATRVDFTGEKGKTLGSLMIGKFSYKQVSNPYGYGGNNIEGTSFVRLSDDKKIYAVEGFLSFSISGRFDDWRERSFLKCKKDDITKITFNYPSDSSFILIKKESDWFAGELKADSLITAEYLGSLDYIEGEIFRDGFQPAAQPAYTMIVEGNNLLNITVKCYPEADKDKYVFNSGLKPEIYYEGTKSGLFDKLFKPMGYFLPNENKDKK